MRRTIIVGLAICTVAFLIAGLYIITTIHHATQKLDNLIMLHQVEILREHYLIQIKRVQTDLLLRETPHAPKFDTVVSHVRSMGQVIDTCGDCHHEPAVAARLSDLKRETDLYENSLARVLTGSASRERRAVDEEAAFRIGQDLIDKVSDMISITGARLEASTQRTLKEINGTKLALYVMVGAGPFALAALGWILIASLMRPVHELLSSTRRLQAGDLTHRAGPMSGEFGELGTAFNEMAASLDEQMHRAQRAEQMAVVGKLAAGLAHEIKNPLAGIKAAMSILADEAQLGEEDRDIVRRVSGEVTRVEALMKSFLSFAKPPRPQPASVDLASLIESTLALHLRVPRTTGPVEVTRDLAATGPIVADAMQLQQVLLNLVLNALDAMPQGGTLTVATRGGAAAGWVTISVADTGKGIPPEAAARLFEPFYTTKARGTGLGLAISRQLVEQVGGEIQVAPAEGGGTVFTIRLPQLGEPRAEASA